MPKKSFDEFLEQQAPTAETDGALEDVGIDPSVGLKYAHAVFWALDNADNPRMTRKAAGSGSRYKLWKLARDDFQAFVTKVVQPAHKIIEKAGGADEDEEEIQREENREVKSMQALLRRARDEALAT